MILEDSISAAFTDGSTYVAVQGHVVASVAGEAVILHRENGTYFGLNSVGSRVWELIQQDCTLHRLVETIVAEYDVGTERARCDVEQLLDALVREGLARRIR